MALKKLSPYHAGFSNWIAQILSEDREYCVQRRCQGQRGFICPAGPSVFPVTGRHESALARQKVPRLGKWRRVLRYRITPSKANSYVPRKSHLLKGLGGANAVISWPHRRDASSIPDQFMAGLATERMEVGRQVFVGNFLYSNVHFR
jgi:hypothetical protein